MPSSLPARTRSAVVQRLASATLSALLILPTGVYAQTPEPTQSAQPVAPTDQTPLPAVSTPALSKAPGQQLTGQQLTDQQLTEQDQRYLLILNRFTYGPRPGDLEKMRASGINAWFQQQIRPETIDDSALEARLANYPAMKMQLRDLVAMFPSGEAIRAEMNGKTGRPGGEGEKAIYKTQEERYKDRQKKKSGDEGAAAPAVLPQDPQAYLALPPDKRFSALCRLTLPQLKLLRDGLKGPDKDKLTEGFRPDQLEVLAALQNPHGVVEAEDLQTKLLCDIYSERQLNEVMTDFWLNHFNVYMKKNQDAPYYIAAYERHAIRPHALGNFENLLDAVASSPAMLSYLDNSSSVGPHSPFANRPGAGGKGQQRDGLNENYARELMELHTVGVGGGYSQHDVTEVAKVFTGWTVNRPSGAGVNTQTVFDESKHESGSKTVLGVTIKENGLKEGAQVLHILATSPRTAQFISRKLAVRFVSDNPPQAMIDRMAAAFTKSSGNIRFVLITMVNSPEFFTTNTYRSKLKTPQDYVVSAVRAAGADVASPGALVGVLADLGMPLYGMQTPNGYGMTADKWNNTASLVARLNFALALSSNRVAGVTVDWAKLMSTVRAPSYQATEDPDADPAPKLSAEQKEAVLEKALLHLSVSDRTRHTILAQISTNPEKQEADLRALAVNQRDPLSSWRPARRPDGSTLDSQTALAAGLLLGSPEFQRR